jgi:hypothetical protein
MAKPWFVVKRYGVGLSPSGPGWVLVLAYVAAWATAGFWIRLLGPIPAAVLMAAVTIGFFVIMARTSDHKPWRWRRGDDNP